jgi:PIN domain nuclease of toxin-antitoxin system
MKDKSFLIDTHCWLWLNLQPKRLTPPVIDVLTNADNEIIFSVVSAWEIAIKYALGKLKLPLEPSQYVPSRLQANQMTILPVTLAHVLKVEQLPFYHNDPFDRLLIAISQLEGFTLITADKQFKAYDIDILW